MKNNIITSVLVASVISIVTLLLMSASSEKNKIAVIDSNKLIENYRGFKEAQDLYQLKIEEHNNDLVKLQNLLSLKENEYKKSQNNLSESKKTEKQLEIKNLEISLQNLQKSLEQISFNAEKELLQGVYNKIDAFIKKYSEEYGYSLVVSADGSGNILFNSQSIDRTEEVISLINKEFSDGF